MALRRRQYVRRRTPSVRCRICAAAVPTSSKFGAAAPLHRRDFTAVRACAANFVVADTPRSADARRSPQLLRDRRRCPPRNPAAFNAASREPARRSPPSSAPSPFPTRRTRPTSPRATSKSQASVCDPDGVLTEPGVLRVASILNDARSVSMPCGRRHRRRAGGGRRRALGAPPPSRRRRPSAAPRRCSSGGASATAAATTASRSSSPSTTARWRSRPARARRRSSPTPRCSRSSSR